MNFYYNNEQMHNGGPTIRPARNTGRCTKIIVEFDERYNRPIFLAEQELKPIESKLAGVYLL
jgi:hypothetical protein